MTSAQRKLAHGIELAKQLRNEVQMYEWAHAYELRVERGPKVENGTVYTCFAVERQPPPQHWPELAGDAIQNLRSSLDHAIWAACDETKRGTWTQFPVCIDPQRYGEEARRRLRGLDAARKDVVRELQPFNGILRDYPELDWLWQLVRLSNDDKHRTLATIAAATWTPYVAFTRPAEADETEGPNLRDVRHGAALSDGAEVMTFIASARVKSDPRLGYGVELEGKPLVNLISGVAARAHEATNAIEQAVRTHKWGYPLLELYQ